MTTDINLTSIYIANLMAVVLICIIFSEKRWRVVNDRVENLCVKIMVLTAVLACTLDTLAFTFDGKSGLIGWLFVFLGNGLLFSLNLVIGPAWSVLVIHHVRGVVKKYEKNTIIILCAIGLILLLVNVFCPIVYHVDEFNVYHRDSLYWYYLLMEVFFMAYGCVAYYKAKSKGGILKFFPVLHFIVPILIGLGVQTVFYGVSTIPPFIAISISCMINSLQCENLYRDSLTGIYNRTYLDYLKRDMGRKNNGEITAIMIDLNDFKSINDKYGHKVGDEALIDFANILRNGIGEMGSVIRYAGDEFVILLNTEKEVVARNYIEQIKKSVCEFNEKKNKLYKLSFAIGYYSIDLKSKSVDDLLNEVDRRMYLDKEAYYINNPQRDRRK